MPPETILDVGQRLVIVGFDPRDQTKATAFRTQYHIGPSVQLVGPFAGQLLDSGGVVRLSRLTDNGTGQSGFILADQVIYDDVSPWPVAADGSGASLHRAAPGAPGSLASSWSALAPTPGISLSTLIGDLDRDGDLDGDDTLALAMALNDPETYERTYGVSPVLHGDTDADGDLDFDDIAAFVELF
jgi:hypothetical protein